MTFLFIAIVLFGVALCFVAYRVGRASARRPPGAAPLPPPPASPAPTSGSARGSTSVHAPVAVGRLVFALTGCALLVVGCFVPGSLVEHSLFGSGPALGTFVYMSSAIVAALLAVTGRFQSLRMPGGICILILLSTLAENALVARQLAREHVPAEVADVVFGIGPAWGTLFAGALLLVLVGMAGPPWRASAGFSRPPRH
jgi:hypothetical protein